MWHSSRETSANDPNYPPIFPFYYVLTICAGQLIIQYPMCRNHPTLLPLALCLAMLAVGTLCAPAEDLVTDNITHLDYKHNWYSGYLNFSKSNYHYVFFDSQHDPDNDPLVLWLNGGPGCSSLIGMVYENGPFLFEPNTTMLVLNDYAWNKRANLLYI